jgi:glutathione synthase/RimK-type ligase-like ATP-grasp enzyme
VKSRNPIAHLQIARSLARIGDLSAARVEFEAALQLSPDLIVAHLGYAEMLTRQGDVAAALEHIAAGYKPAPGVTVPYTGDTKPIRVLQLACAIQGGHINTDAFLDAQRFEVTTVVVEYWDPTRPFPTHDVVVNSIADADLCDSALYVAEWLLERTSAPVVNAPALARETGRVANARRLGDLPGIVVPKIESFSREALLAGDALDMLAQHGFMFPLLVRSPGHHNGRHFSKVDTAAALAATVAELPGDELLVLQFIDLREPDGTIRKYRAVIVDGAVLPAHLAVSDAWKIHYFSAKMGDAEHAEEARYFADVRRALGDKVVDGLESIARTLGLEYLGVDFGVDAERRAVIFEANASMTIFLPEDDDASRYRRAPVLAIYDAARRMVTAKAR